MELDIDKIRAERKEQKEKDRAEIAALTTHLEGLLTNPPPCDNLFKRQAEMLDSLLYALMRRNLAEDKKSGAFNADGINLALRIQRQSLDTARAFVAHDYMQCLAGMLEEKQRRSTLNALHDRPRLSSNPEYTPHPPENDEQTGEF